jgi:hypothetical protein
MGRCGSHGIPDEERLVGVVVDEDAAMAAVEHPAHPVLEVLRRGEPRGWSGDGEEADQPVDVLVEAEHGDCSMECAEADDEGGVADEAAPALADERGDQEVPRIRREAKVVRHQIHRRRAAARPEALRHISVPGLAAHLGIALHFVEKSNLQGFVGFHFTFSHSNSFHDFFYFACSFS